MLPLAPPDGLRAPVCRAGRNLCFQLPVVCELASATERKNGCRWRGACLLSLASHCRSAAVHCRLWPGRDRGPVPSFCRLDSASRSLRREGSFQQWCVDHELFAKLSLLPAVISLSISSFPVAFAEGTRLEAAVDDAHVAVPAPNPDWLGEAAGYWLVHFPSAHHKAQAWLNDHDSFHAVRLAGRGRTTTCDFLAQSPVASFASTQVCLLSASSHAKHFVLGLLSRDLAATEYCQCRQDQLRQIIPDAMLVSLAALNCFNPPETLI